MTKSFPLQWPAHIERSKDTKSSQFKTTLPRALENVQDSLRRFGVDSGRVVKDLVISSNYSLGDRSPRDAGVAVWFTWDGLQVCIPVDRYSKLEDNLQAIHHVIEARRTELRHGTLALVRATFQGFKALPPAASSEARSWRVVLGFPPTGPISAADIEVMFKRLAKTRHPDVRGGSTEKMAELNRAREEALKEAGHGGAA